MALYDNKLAAAKNVELVHISCDQDEAGMKKFMGGHNLKCPVIDAATADKIKVLKDLSPRGIPNYKLVDASGKLLAEGSDAKHKAEEFAAAAAAGGGDAEAKN